MQNFIRMKELLELPPLVKFSDNIGYQRLCRMVAFTKNKNILLKILKELSKYTDYSEEVFHNDKMKALIVCFEEQTPKVLAIIRKFVTEIHQLKEIIPVFDRLKKDDLIKCFDYISRYNKDTFMEVISYLNHKKLIKLILNKAHKKEILLEIEKIKSSILKKTETMLYKREYGAGYEIFLSAKRRNERINFTYAPDMMFDELEFIKDPVIASFWGGETKCCLKKGGAAQELLEPIEKSPIAGEIVGKLRGKKMSSYTWDMVECIDGKAYKTLILDNIESPVTLNEKDTEYLFNTLNSFGKYKNIYLGTVRNDCTVNEKYQIKDRQSLLPGFRTMFKNSFYTHADSDKIYIMREHEENPNCKVRPMNISDLHLCKYVEEYIYGKDIYNEDDKTDIIKQVTLDTPCFIIDSETNIYGYMLTKWKYFNENNREVFSKNGQKKFYIEDLVVAKDRKVLIKLKEIFDDLAEWLLKHKIAEVYLHTNKFSKNFKKRLERIGIKVVEEKMEVIKPINHLV